MTPRSPQQRPPWPEPDPKSSAEIVIQAVVDGVDQLALTMERKWGVGRLRLLVEDELRARFDAQQAKLDAALVAGQLAYVQAQALGMRRAWQALDQAATAAGAVPLAPEVWECVLPGSGEVVAIVRSAAEAHHVARRQRVFTLVEVARLIEALGEGVLEVKRVFPGAAVAEIRSGAAGRENTDAPPF